MIQEAGGTPNNSRKGKKNAAWEVPSVGTAWSVRSLSCIMGSAENMRPENLFQCLFGFYYVTASMFKGQHRKPMPEACLA